MHALNKTREALLAVKCLIDIQAGLKVEKR